MLSLGWIIVWVLISFAVVGGILALVLFKIYKSADRKSDKMQLQSNKFENMLIKAGCEGWLTDLLAAFQAGAEEEVTRLIQQFVTATDSEAFFVENIAEPMSVFYADYKKRQRAKAAPAKRRTTTTSTAKKK